MENDINYTTEQKTHNISLFDVTHCSKHHLHALIYTTKEEKVNNQKP